MREVLAALLEPALSEEEYNDEYALYRDEWGRGRALRRREGGGGGDAGGAAAAARGAAGALPGGCVAAR